MRVLVQPGCTCVAADNSANGAKLIVWEKISSPVQFELAFTECGSVLVVSWSGAGAQLQSWLASRVARNNPALPPGYNSRQDCGQATVASAHGKGHKRRDLAIGLTGCRWVGCDGLLNLSHGHSECFAQTGRVSSALRFSQIGNLDQQSIQQMRNASII
jgi:hypothetical protein